MRALRRRDVVLLAAVAMAAMPMVARADVTAVASSSARGHAATGTQAKATSYRLTHLVGLWRVLDAHERPGTTLVLGESGTRDLQLLRPCGELQGEWSADRTGQFVGMMDAGDGSCFKAHHLTVSWLQHVIGYRWVGRRVKLLGPGQKVLAVLRPELSVPKSVRPDPKHDSPITRPVVTARTRRDLSPPAPLPTGVQPASPQSLVGSWDAVGHPAPKRGFVAFKPGNNWRGSDGCNGYAGRYILGSGGRLLVLDGPNGAVGCLMTPAPGWVEQAARVAVTPAGRLMLFNSHGHRVGALRPRARN